MSKKNIVIIVIAVVLIIIGIILLNNRSTDNETSSGKEQKVEVNQSPIVTKKTNGTYEIFNTNITTDGGSTKIKASIKNISGSKTQEQYITLVLVDKDNKELGEIKVTVPSLENGVATNIAAESLKVYENIYDFKIE